MKLAPPAVLIVVLSPKSQDRLSGKDPLEVSVKVTAKGAPPLVGLAVKLANGAVPAVLRVASPFVLGFDP